MFILQVLKFFHNRRYGLVIRLIIWSTQRFLVTIPKLKYFSKTVVREHVIVLDQQLVCWYCRESPHTPVIKSLISN